MKPLTVRQLLMKNYLANLFLDEKETIMKSEAVKHIVNSFVILDVAAASAVLAEELEKNMKAKGGDS